MHKLSGNSLDKFNKSCSVFHQESNKIEFAFFRFLYDFFRDFLSSSNLPHTIQELALHQSPWNISNPHRNALALHLGPYKDSNPCTSTLPSPGGLAGGDGQPVLANKWRGTPRRSPRGD
jgi:hypothetical protein